MSGRTTSTLVVFASGRGSNLRALCEAAASGMLHGRIEALVTNVPGAQACAVAREFGIPVLEVDSRGKTREAHEAAVLTALAPFKCDWIVLAGYMRLFTPEFVQRHWDDKLSAARIVNIHPSLLPSFPGKDGYVQALQYGVKVTGATVHLVGRGLDDGPIIAQRTLDISDDETEATLSGRGLELEHSLYVDALAKLLGGAWSMSAGSRPEGRPRIVFEQPKQDGVR